MSRNGENASDTVAADGSNMGGSSSGDGSTPGGGSNPGSIADNGSTSAMPMTLGNADGTGETVGGDASGGTDYVASGDASGAGSDGSAGTVTPSGSAGGTPSYLDSSKAFTASDATGDWSQKGVIAVANGGAAIANAITSAGNSAANGVTAWLSSKLSATEDYFIRAALLVLGIVIVTIALIVLTRMTDVGTNVTNAAVAATI